MAAKVIYQRKKVTHQQTKLYQLKQVACLPKKMKNHPKRMSQSEFLWYEPRARYIPSRLGLGINLIQLITSYNDIQFVAVALFIVTQVQITENCTCTGKDYG